MRKFYLLYLLVLLASLPAYGQDLSFKTLDTLRQVHDLNTAARILEDSTLTITSSLLIRGEYTDQFQLLADFNHSEQANHNYWVRIPVTSNTGFHHWWLMVKSSIPENEYYPQWDEMEVLMVDTLGNQVDHQLGGIHDPASKKRITFDAGLNAVDFTLPANEPRIIYIRLSKTFFALATEKIRIELRNPAIGIPENRSGSELLVLSGIAATLSLLSFFFFLFVREKAYFCFCLFLLFLSLHYLILHPQLPFVKWFIPEHPELSVYFFYFFAVGGFMLILLFGRYFINLPALSKRVDYWYRTLIVSWTSLLIIELIFMSIFKKHILFPAAFLIILVALGFLIRIAFFKSPLARIFVAGTGWLLIFSLLGIFGSELMQSININPWPIGQIGQIMIYMVGLAYKVRLNEQEKAKALRIREMDEIKSRFFANISHEFRTPLTLIKGILQQSNDQIKGREKKELTIPVSAGHIHMMERNADRLLELVNQLLDLAHLDSGKIKLHIVRGDVVQVLRTLTHGFDGMAERKHIQYQHHIPASDEISYYDRDKLEKIVVNLLSNAFKYTPDGGRVNVTVELHDQTLQISVADSGPGILLSEQDKVFDRFYQLEGTEVQGSGIGLALVKELVEVYGGQIVVHSLPDQGSTFTVTLPRQKELFGEVELVEKKYIGKGEQAGHLVKTETQIHTIENERPTKPILLLVEDNADLCEFIRESMKDDYHVLVGKNGSEGLELAISEIPDLIISDVMMPLMDGFELTNRLKKDERTSHIPIILLTAKVGQSHKIDGLEKGADDYLTKPFDSRELRVRATNLVEGRKRLRKKFAGAITLKPSEVSVSSQENVFLLKVMTAIEAHLAAEEFGVEELAQEVAMSRSQLHRKLIAIIDKSPSELLRQTRLLRAKELLLKKASSPAEVAFLVGFNSHSYFSKCFKEEFGVNPSEV